MDFVNLSGKSAPFLIPLYSRAEFTKRGLLKDDKAVDLLNLLGYSKKKLKLSLSSQAFLAIRSLLIDDYVKDFICKHEGDCVVIQLGCGLDSRYTRLNYKNVKWYDLDLYGSIQLRKKFYNPNKNYKMIESNVCNFSWIEKIEADDFEKPTLIISEGLFMYLSERDNEYIFKNLCRYFKGADIIFDCFTPTLVKLSKFSKALSRTGSSFKFGLKSYKDLLKIDKRLSHIKTLSYNINKYVDSLPLRCRMNFAINRVFFDNSKRIEIFHIKERDY